MEALAPFVLLLVLLLVVLAICWLILPFAVIGLKPLLRSILEEQRRTNALLTSADKRMRDQVQPPSEKV